MRALTATHSRNIKFCILICNSVKLHPKIFVHTHINYTYIYTAVYYINTALQHLHFVIIMYIWVVWECGWELYVWWKSKGHACLQVKIPCSMSTWSLLLYKVTLQSLHRVPADIAQTIHTMHDCCWLQFSSRTCACTHSGPLRSAFADSSPS